MTRTQLATAGATLDTAAERAEAERDRLADIARQLESLAEADRGPDHGRLARIQAALQEIQEAVDEETATTIDDAREQISTYRETVEGV